MATTKSARWIGAAIAALFVTAACGQNPTVSNTPPPDTDTGSVSRRAPERDDEKPQGPSDKDPFAAPEQEPEPVVVAPEPDPPPDRPPPPPPPPPLKKDHGDWSYPPLDLTVGYIKGRVYVGARAINSDGCGGLVGSGRGRHIRVKGMHDPEPKGGYACTQATVPHWVAVAVPEGRTSVLVTYAGRKGRYQIDVSRDGVETRYHGGLNVAPPESETWWWIPDDILFAHAWYGNPEAVKRVSDRVHERLMDEGASVFEAPEGRPIPTGSYPSQPPYDDDPREYRDDLQARSRERVYRSGLSWDELRDIAHEEAQTERCTFVHFTRDPYRDGVFGRPPCDRD